MKTFEMIFFILYAINIDVLAKAPIIMTSKNILLTIFS